MTLDEQHEALRREAIVNEEFRRTGVNFYKQYDILYSNLSKLLLVSYTLITVAGIAAVCLAPLKFFVLSAALCLLGAVLLGIHIDKRIEAKQHMEHFKKLFN